MSETIKSAVVEIEGRAKGSVCRYFIVSASVILLATGLAKIWSSLGTARVLAQGDPLIRIQFGHLMLVVGIVEIVVALLCFFGKSYTLTFGLVAWLATIFFVYRIGLWWIGYHKPCSCLGNLTDALHISPQTADTAMRIILAYLLIGSYASLFWLRRQKRRVGDGSWGQVTSPNTAGT